MSDGRQFTFEQKYEWAGEDLRLELSQPVEFGKEVYPELVFHPLKGSDFFDLPPGEMTLGGMAKLASASARVPNKLIGDLCAQDFLAVMQVVGVFFAGGRETLPTGST